MFRGIETFSVSTKTDSYNNHLTYQQNFPVGSWSLGAHLSHVCLTVLPSWNSWTVQECRYQQGAFQQNGGLQHHECPTDQMLFPKKKDRNNNKFIWIKIKTTLSGLYTPYIYCKKAHFFVHFLSATCSKTLTNNFLWINLNLQLVC